MSGEDEFVWRGSQLRGSGGMNLSVSVDARGASDPAAVRAAVKDGGNELLRQVTRLLASGVGAG